MHHRFPTHFQSLHRSAGSGGNTPNPAVSALSSGDLSNAASVLVDAEHLVRLTEAGSVHAPATTNGKADKCKVFN